MPTMSRRQITSIWLGRQRCDIRKMPSICAPTDEHHALVFSGTRDDTAGQRRRYDQAHHQRQRHARIGRPDAEAQLWNNGR